MKTVIKEIPVKFNSKKEFAMALLEGRKFKAMANQIICWNELSNSPFRYGAVGLDAAWNLWQSDELMEVIEEEVRWEDELKNKPNGILCWVWDEYIDEYKSLNIVYSFNPEVQYRYKTKDNVYRFAVPLIKEEVLKLCYEEVTND